ncbi:MAG: 2-dehydropantoate 2-reductase [Candidatus Tumulicola sp.]
MRIAIVGAGAIGGFLAGALARSGVPVAIVARGEHLRAIAGRGLEIESDLGRFTAQVEASDDLRTLGTFDAVVCTFKAHQWKPLLPQLEAVARDGATLVTLQNGLPFWYVRDPPLRSVDPEGRVAALFPDERIAGGVVHVSGTVVAPGRIVQSGGTRYVLGDPRGGVTPRVTALIDLLRAAGLDAEADPDVRSTVWLKLVNNVGLNATSALRGMRIRPLLADAESRDDVRTLMLEALNVGRAFGFAGETDVDARIAYAARLADVKTSMLQDLERGRELELEPILGAVVELAERCGVEVPRIRANYAALRALDAKARA